jgi:hypothetical protein
MPQETFRWQESIFDVTAMLRDIQSGDLQPERIELEPAFIEAYCRLYLALKRPNDSPPLSVDHTHADRLTAVDLQEPIVLAWVGEGEGLVSLREDECESHYVVVDGNHRLLAAQRLGLPLSALLVCERQSLAYRKGTNGMVP